MIDAKHRLVKSKKVGVHPKADLIISEEDPILVALYAKTLAINKSTLKRSYVEAALLCSNDYSEICRILDLSLEVLEFYKEFFFDVTDLDKLSKIEHIESVSEPSERSLKLWALGQGLEFLAWRLGDKVTMSPIDGLVEMFSTCMYKAKESVYTTNSTEASKEALKWTKMSADIARLLKVWTMDSSAAKKDLEIAIREVVPTFMGLDSLLEENRNL